MYKKGLEIKNSPQLSRFITACAQAANVDCDSTSDDTRTTFRFSLPSAKAASDFIAEITAKIAVWFYKPKVVARSLNHPADSVAVAALLGAVAAYRQDEEKAIVADKVRDLDLVNADGVVDFMLKDLTEEWKELGNLTARLYAQCQTADEVSELVSFMLGLEKSRTGELKLFCDDKITLDGADIPLVEIFAKSHLAIIYTALLARPASIVVTQPQNANADLVAFIKSLGSA